MKYNFLVAINHSHTLKDDRRWKNGYERQTRQVPIVILAASRIACFKNFLNSPCVTQTYYHQKRRTEDNEINERPTCGEQYIGASQLTKHRNNTEKCQRGQWIAIGQREICTNNECEQVFGTEKILNTARCIIAEMSQTLINPQKDMGGYIERHYMDMEYIPKIYNYVHGGAICSTQYHAELRNMQFHTKRLWMETGL